MVTWVVAAGSGMGGSGGDDRGGGSGYTGSRDVGECQPPRMHRGALAAAGEERCWFPGNHSLPWVSAALDRSRP